METENVIAESNENKEPMAQWPLLGYNEHPKAFVELANEVRKQLLDDLLGIVVDDYHRKEYFRDFDEQADVIMEVVESAPQRRKLSQEFTHACLYEMLYGVTRDIIYRARKKRNDHRDAAEERWRSLLNRL